MNKLNDYKLVVQDNAGFVVPEYSVSVLMGRCTNFANEKSQLELFAKVLAWRL
jgi:hypothetical protein